MLSVDVEKTLGDFFLAARFDAAGSITALFGPSGEHEWGPWMVQQRVVVSRRHPCRPCGIDGCGGGKVSECLTSLSVAEVHAEFEALLAQSAGARVGTPVH